MPRAATCECGSCETCKRREYMRDYYRRPDVAERTRTRVRAYRLANLATVRAADRARGYRLYDDLKARARAAVRIAKLHREPCEVCGATEHVEAHHPDYSKPLDVRWLCRAHHGEVHRMVI